MQSSKGQSTAWATTLTLNPGQVSTLAGNTSSVVVDGKGAAASFLSAHGMSVVGGYGYVFDYGYLRRVDLGTGVVQTVAGNGTIGCFDSGDPLNATVDGVGPMASDGEDLYFLNRCGYGDTYLRRMSLTTGAIDTLFYRGYNQGPNALTIGPGGVLYAATGSAVERIDTVAKTATTVLNVPSPSPGVNVYLNSLAADGNFLWAVDFASTRLLRIDLTLGVVTEVSRAGVTGPLVSAGDYVYSAVGSASQLRRFAKSDGSWVNVAGVASGGFMNGTGSEAWFGGIAGIDTDGEHLFVTDTNRVRVVSPASPLSAAQPATWSNTVAVGPAIVSTVAGHGSAAVVDGTGLGASFQSPAGWTVAGGFGYTVDAGYLRRVNLATGEVHTVAGTGSASCQDNVNGSQATVDRGPGGMASDGTFLYWLNWCGYGETYLRRMSLSTGAVSTIFYRGYNQGHFSLTVGADGLLYASRLGGVERIDPETGEATGVITPPAGVTIRHLAADATGLWGIGFQDCANGANNNCTTIYRLDPTTGTTAPLGGRAPQTDFLALMPTGSLVSSGDYLYGSFVRRDLTGNEATGMARWNKATGATTLVVGTDAGSVDLGESPATVAVDSLDTDGSVLYGLDVINRRVVRLNQLPPGIRVEQTYGPGAASTVDDACACATTLARNGATDAPVADPVNTATGAFYEQVTDASLPGAGTTFGFIRTYNSNDTTTGRLGVGWTDPYEASLDIAGPTSDITFRAEDGAQAVFTRNSDGTFRAPAGVRSTLTTIADGYRVTTPDRRTASFDAAGHLTARADAHGVGLDFAWTGGRMTTITDSADREVSMTYSPSSGLLTRLLLPDGRHVDYDYTAGRLTSVTDLGGKIWIYDYGAAGQLTTITNPLGHDVVTNTYDPTTGRVSAQSDGEANTTRFGWDADTETATVTNPDGGEWTYRYKNNVLLAVTAPDSHTTSYSYDDHLNTVAVRNARGAVTTSSYDDHGNRLTTRSPHPIDAVTQWTYDADNNITRITDPLGHHTDYEYNATGDLTKETTPEGAITTLHYNTDGTLDWVTDPRGNATGATASQYRTHYGYDDDANLTSVTSPLGRHATLSYDSAGRRTSSTDPRGNTAGADPEDFTTTTNWTDNDQVHRVIDPLGHITTNVYDAAGNLVSVTDPGNHTTRYNYNQNNQLTQVTDVLGHHSDYIRDWAGHAVTTIDPDGNATTADYDKLGRLSSTVSPRGNRPGASRADYTTSYTYDPVGNQTMVSHPLPDGGAATVTTDYDVLNRPVGVTDPGGKVTEHHYDKAGRETATTDPLGAVTTSDFDDDSRLVASTNPNQKTTHYGYDDAGNLTTRIDSAERATTWTYDQDGLQSTETGPDGLATTFEHDPAGNLTSTDFADPATHDVTIDYDPLDRRSSMTDASGTSTYAYTDTGKLDHVTDGHGDTLGYDYDTVGRLRRLTYPGTTGAVTYAYSDGGRMIGLTDWADRTFAFGYNPDGQLTGIDYPNGVSTAQDYDIAGRLTGIETTHVGTIVDDHDYSYNTRSLLTARTDVISGETTTSNYTWDDAAQLNTSTSGDYAFDPAHQLTTQPTTEATYDDAGQLVTTTSGSVASSYTFNRRGDRTTTTSATDGATSYTYSQDDRLVGYQHASIQTAYNYDGDGLRTAVVRGTGSGASTEHYTWDVAGALTELIGDGAKLYLYGPSATPLAQIDTTSGAVDYLHHDINGTTRALTDDTGTVEATASYDPYGSPTTHTGTAGTAFGYAGEYTDPDTGLVYLRARYYDPATAQFLTRDPLEDETGAPYNYAAGDPLDLSDPMGLDVCVFGHCVETPSLEDAGNWAAGFGDTVTFGGTKQIRRLINYEVNGDMDDMVDHCSDFYHWGGYGGDIANFFDVPAGISRFLERRGLLKGQEIVFNKNFRVAPLGGSKPKSPADFFPHYHRRGARDMFGNTPEGQGIGRHRPWQTSDTDSSFWDRF
jgi:RHS repeat-associated protein